jgi:hypothetical protein
MRVFLGWLRGEQRHCSMVAIPTIEEEDARRPNRERQNLVIEQTRIINQIKAIFSASAFALYGRPSASLPKGLKICARRKARHCHRTRFRSCAAISRGYTSYATRSAQSNRNTSASSR